MRQHNRPSIGGLLPTGGRRVEHRRDFHFDECAADPTDKADAINAEVLEFLHEVSVLDLEHSAVAHHMDRTEPKE